MYADRVAAGNKRSVKDRLNGNTNEGLVRTRQINGKRQRQTEEKWEHDLYEDDGPQSSNPKVGVRDLRMKLQKKGSQIVNQAGRGNAAGNVRDLREKLSGVMHPQPPNSDVSKIQTSVDIAKPARKRAKVEAAVPDSKTASNPAPLKKSQQKADSVDGLLRSLGLEKYSITFQAEEVDMTALMHMTDEDLKALGTPMYRFPMWCHSMLGIWFGILKNLHFSPA